jgi:hypothetical protein
MWLKIGPCSHVEPIFAKFLRRLNKYVTKLTETSGQSNNVGVSDL